MTCVNDLVGVDILQDSWATDAAVCGSRSAVADVEAVRKSEEANGSGSASASEKTE